eukprot:2394698-Rhodomonas_salina.2
MQQAGDILQWCVEDDYCDTPPFPFNQAPGPHGPHPLSSSRQLEIESGARSAHSTRRHRFLEFPLRPVTAILSIHTVFVSHSQPNSPDMRLLWFTTKAHVRAGYCVGLCGEGTLPPGPSHNRHALPFPVNNLYFELAQIRGNIKANTSDTLTNGQLGWPVAPETFHCSQRFPRAPFDRVRQICVLK